MLQQKRKLQLLMASLVSSVLMGCGGGSGSSQSNNNNDDNSSNVVNFGQTVSGLVMADGDVALPDGQNYNANSSAISLSDFTWEIDGTDSDQSELDDPFSGM